MELLKSVNHKHMCMICNEDNTKCTGCTYSAARQNKLLYNNIMKTINEKKLGLITLRDFEGRLR